MSNVMMNELIEARTEFPGAANITYLDLGGRGLLSDGVRKAIEAHLDDVMAGKLDKAYLFKKTEEARDRFAALINAQPDEITYTKNTSEGLNIVATSIEWRLGDNVIVCPELEHPNNIYLWLNLKRYGVEVRFVHHENGHMPIEKMIAAIDKRTRLLTVSSVSFTPGFRTDMNTLGRACRAQGVLFLVDGAQSVGVLHTDVVESCIDALSVSTQKGLLGLYGMGYLYIRRELAENMQPVYIARFGVDLGKNGAHESDFNDGSFDFMPGARRFDLGNYNFAAMCAAHESLAFIHKLGTKNIEPYVLELTRELHQGFLDLGIPVCGGKPGPHMGHILTIGHYGAEGITTERQAKMDKLYAYLIENNVKLSMRRGVLRFSMHIYNNMDDINRTLALTAKALEQ
jgi:cysteine desulfurase / selenocysteine lyase